MKLLKPLIAHFFSISIVSSADYENKSSKLFTTYDTHSPYAFKVSLFYKISYCRRKYIKEFVDSVAVSNPKLSFAMGTYDRSY